LTQTAVRNEFQILGRTDEAPTLKSFPKTNSPKDSEGINKEEFSSRGIHVDIPFGHFIFALFYPIQFGR
jgi:hypothetical protein